MLRSLHCCGGQSLRPAELTAVSMSVTWRGLGTLEGYEPHQGQWMQGACTARLWQWLGALSRGSLQLLEAQCATHMWEQSGQEGKEAQHSRARFRSPEGTSAAKPPTRPPSRERSLVPGHGRSPGRFQFLQGDWRTHLLQPPYHLLML